MSVSPRFSIGQDIRDTKLMGCLVEYFGCGYVAEKRSICEYIVTRSQDIVEKLYLFFLMINIPLEGRNLEIILTSKQLKS